MSRPIYVPIADSFFESSIMQESLPTRFVMLALIRLALRPGANGVVDVDLRTFAGSINMPLAEVEAAITRLMEPDPLSSSPDEDGRRIVPVDPSRPFRNWRLVNWPRYKGIVNRANDAARKRDERAHVAKDITDASENVQKRPALSENGGNGVTNTKTKTKTKEEKEPRRFAPPSLEEVQSYITEKGYPLDAEAFMAHYTANGWVQSSGRPIKDWKAAVVTWAKRPRLFQPATATPRAPLPQFKTARMVEEEHEEAERRRLRLAEQTAKATKVAEELRQKAIEDEIYAEMLKERADEKSVG